MDPAMVTAAYLAIGGLAGLLAGLLGVGGGLVMVPGLTLVLALQGLPQEVLVHTAVATSLAVIMATGSASAMAHHRMGRVNWTRVKRLAPTIALGALLGAAIATQLTGNVLRLFVGLFELWVALRIGLRPKVPPAQEPPTTPESRAAGGLIGAVSALMGIAGGTLTVPYLLRRHVTIHEAVSVSAVLGVPIAIAGTLGFMVLGWNHPTLAAGNLGYVYLPAFVPVAIASALLAPVGAKLAHSLTGPALKRVFAVFLAVAGVLMLAG